MLLGNVWILDNQCLLTYCSTLIKKRSNVTRWIRAQPLTSDDLGIARDSDLSLMLEFIQVTCPP